MNGGKRTGVLTTEVRVRATRILTLAASSSGETLLEIAWSIEETRKHQNRKIEIDVCKAAINASIEAGNWREVRAEAAQKLREGWIPPGFTKGT